MLDSDLTWAARTERATHFLRVNIQKWSTPIVESHVILITLQMRLNLKGLKGNFFRDPKSILPQIEGFFQ